MHALFQVVTNFGESAFLMALAATTSACFMAGRCYREAAAILLAFAGSSIAILCLKLVFLSCGHGLFNDAFNIRSPSGHTALAVGVFGTYALILAVKAFHARRVPAALYAASLAAGLAALACAIAFTRILLGAHTTGEVLLGGLTGLGAVLAVSPLLWRDRGRRRGPRLPDDRAAATAIKTGPNPWLLIASTLLVGLLAYGTKIPAENKIRGLSSRIQTLIPACRTPPGPSKPAPGTTNHT